MSKLWTWLRWLSGMFCGVLLASFALQARAGNFPGEQPVYSRDQGRQTLLFYVSGGNGNGKVEYICTADAGITATSARWQIAKLVYDGSNRVSTVTWAGGTDNFTNVCSDRASLTYS